ncbi:MAG: Ig-like domain-containing protein [Spirochaetaceae bacterium]|nr:Ig-like domain-containing protein [Spirochaetaceae bacterium]
MRQAVFAEQQGAGFIHINQAGGTTTYSNFSGQPEQIPVRTRAGLGLASNGRFVGVCTQNAANKNEVALCGTNVVINVVLEDNTPVLPNDMLAINENGEFSPTDDVQLAVAVATGSSFASQRYDMASDSMVNEFVVAARLTVSVSNSATNPPDLTGITISGSSSNMTTGQTRQLSAAPIPSGASLGSLAWASSDDTVATIDNNGLITATAESGTVTFTATSGSITSNGITINVNVASVPVTPPQQSSEEIAPMGTNLDLDIDTEDKDWAKATREERMARARELGLTVAGNISNDNLIKAIIEAEAKAKEEAK